MDLKQANPPMTKRSSVPDRQWQGATLKCRGEVAAATQKSFVNTKLDYPTPIGVEYNYALAGAGLREEERGWKEKGRAKNVYPVCHSSLSSLLSLPLAFMFCVALLGHRRAPHRIVKQGICWVPRCQRHLSILSLCAYLRAHVYKSSYCLERTNHSSHFSVY